jgi:hypothetical protein
MMWACRSQSRASAKAPAHLGVEAGERRQLLDSVVLDHLHMAGGIFADDGEVDGPDQSAVNELGQVRHDLTGELVAGEAKNHIFHRAAAAEQRRRG